MAEASDPERAKRVADLARAARARIDAAAALDPTHSPIALALLREGAARLAHAWLVEHSPEAAPSTTSPATPDAWACLEGIDASTLGPRPEGFGAASDVMRADADALDALGPGDLERAGRALEEVVAWLAARVDGRSERELRRARWLRRAAVASALAAAVAAPVAIGRVPKNLAFARQVTASSLKKGSPRPSELTNGILEASYGIHTDDEKPDPWVMVDLGSAQPVTTIRVLHRRDGYQTESLPLAMDISSDKATWTHLETRTEAFTQHAPWVVDARGKQARYVRLSMTGKGYIALSELEVY
jgi:hypothetical protein